MNEIERVQVAFSSLLEEDPQTAPSMGKILKRMGRKTVNGRVNKERKRLLTQNRFVLSVRNRYEKTNQWCADCGGTPEMFDMFDCWNC